MRLVVVSLSLVVVAGCGAGGMKVDSKLANACTAANADPGACLELAKDRHAKGDEAGARNYVDKMIVAIQAAPACLRDHDPRGCFGAVVALLHEPPVGLLAPYAVSQELVDFVPRWTGSEATGRRMQARIALHGMCVVAGRDPVEQQRACLVLGDLVEDERFKRCGAGCDEATAKSQLAGWSTTEVIDGYAAACKLAKNPADPAKAAAFRTELARVYQVGTAAGTEPVCAVASSTMRGASIPDALTTMARIRDDARRRDQAGALAKQREAQRIAEMEKQKAAASAQVNAAEAATFRAGALAALGNGDWATTFGLLTKHRGSPIDEGVSAALQRAWQPFSAWVVAQSSLVGAYLELSSRLAKIPPNHTLKTSLDAMRENALKEAKRSARNARGAGGAWLHAALVARIAGPSGHTEADAAAAAYAKLVASTRVALTIDNLAPACTPLMKAPPPGRTVRAKSTLTCTLEPERKTTTKEPFKLKQRVVTEEGEREIEQDTEVEVTHRTFKIIVHGALTVSRGAPKQTIPIDVEVVVDDTDGTDTRTFDSVRAATIAMIQQSVVAPIEAADAQKAYESAMRALSAKRAAAAENHLVTHALLAGSSPELDQLLGAYGVTFAELLPH